MATISQTIRYNPPPIAEFPTLVLLVNKDDENRYKYQLIVYHEELSTFYGPYYSPPNSVKYIQILGNRIDEINNIYKTYQLFHEQGELPNRIEELQRRLEVIGSEFYKDLFDTSFKELYWNTLRDKVTSILVRSEELMIPWELLKPSQRSSEEQFWGEKFCISRCLTEQKDLKIIEIKDFAIIAPAQYVETQDEHYNSAQLEVNSIKSIFLDIEINEVVPPNKDEVLKLFETSRAFSCLHFIGHCKYNSTDPKKSALVLIEEQRLHANELTGRTLNFAENNPTFVFLNACASAGDSYYVAGINGWLRVFAIDAECCGFVGTSWEVSHFAACQFTKSFYSNLLKKEGGLTKCLAKAAQEARLELKSQYPGDPSWLSYVVYAYPFARFYVLENVNSESEGEK